MLSVWPPRSTALEPPANRSDPIVMPRGSVPLKPVESFVMFCPSLQAETLS